MHKTTSKQEENTLSRATTTPTRTGFPHAEIQHSGHSGHLQRWRDDGHLHVFVALHGRRV